jgi:hypothetical protein
MSLHYIRAGFMDYSDSSDDVIPTESGNVDSIFGPDGIKLHHGSTLPDILPFFLSFGLIHWAFLEAVW